MTPRLRRWLRVGVLAVLVLVGGGTAAELYAELHWFRTLGFQARFWKLEITEAAAWTAVFLVTAGSVWFVLRAALRRGGPVQVRRKLGDLEISEALPEQWVGLVLLAAAGVAGFLVASPFAETLGRQALFAAGAEPWGRTDPVLGQDPRFYVFYLPLLRTVWSVLVAATTWIGLGLGTLLLLSGRVQATEKGVTVDEFARRSVTWLGAGVLVLVAGHFALSTFEAVAGGPVNYAEVHGEIPARRLLAALALLAAGALVWAEQTGKWRPALATLGVLAVAWPAGLLFYPGLIQRFRVEPNELELESPYIDAQVEATRRAFGLEEIRRVSYGLTTEQPSMEEVRHHTSSLPLWDDRPLKATYDQLQGLLAYHVFPDVDVDRYGPPDRPEQVAVGVREFAPSRLAPSARTWQNLHLRYTHGTGWVVTAVDEATRGGEPRYYVENLPPQVADDAPAGLALDESKVYFGERTTQYVVVPPDSFPATGPPSGVALSNVFQRAVFAWALDSKNILLRNPAAGAQRLVWRRQVVQRVQHLAPFLLVDPNVYPVAHDGRLKWIVEIYSATTRYPLSEPAEMGGRRFNYVRNVAKAVVDGVTGDVTFYTVAPDDPLLATYRAAFPGLFTPLEEMPPRLRDHLRYPRALFRTQAHVLQAYHMTETEEFYQKQDLWSVGREVYEGQPRDVEPYFLVMPFPGEGEAPGGLDAAAGPSSGGDGGPAGAPDDAGASAGVAGGPQAAPGGAGDGQEEGEPAQEFILTMPFTPRNRDNLSSFMMARSDGEHYGELWLFDLSGQRQVFGPRQVEVQIDQDPVISQQLSLWQQRGSRSIRGHLLLVPVDGYLLYVEPLFLVAEDREGAAPGLKRVIAAAGDRVAMGENLDDALRRLLGERARTAPLEAAPGDAAAAEDDTAAMGTARPAAPVSGPALDRVRQLLQRADRALEQGDLARFGELWEQIREAASQPDAGAGTGVGAGTGGAGSPPDTAAPADTSGAGDPGGP